ncbi:transglutaminase family protein [Candidatus Neomarinimicrobiota bacterium]
MRKKTKPFTRTARMVPAGIILLCVLALNTCTSKDYHLELIARGEFSNAQAIIEDRLRSDPDLSDEKKGELQFEIERMARIRKDFTQTEEEVVNYIRGIIPDVSDGQIASWESTKALEHMFIDGEKRYFNRAGRNLFRIDKDAKTTWEAKYPDQQLTSGSGAKLELDRHNQKIMDLTSQSMRRYTEPVRLRIRQSITVPEGEVPAGETLRCWIPFPREIESRQQGIQLRNTEPEKHLVADNEANLQRTIYFEKMVEAKAPTRFTVEYDYTSYGSYVPIKVEKVIPAEITSELSPFVSEEAPHIVFTPELRELNTQIIGEETNPYLVARRLFEWVDNNIPWASAREYSTIRNISRYAHENMHGDCGIQTLLFITLCRINGIPARWQSGWEFQPPDDSMHDWGEIYFEPYGWAPMDVTYGLRKSEDEELKWFYLHGMDSYRLIFNDAYSQPFYPEKAHPRSETVDSQRGEVEWRGGNLYFDQWKWEFSWEVLDQ